MNMCNYNQHSKPLCEVCRQDFRNAMLYIMNISEVWHRAPFSATVMVTKWIFWSQTFISGAEVEDMFLDHQNCILVVF